ncbi:hypothetical protein ACMWH8_27290 [Klebsiella pneumoniae]|jgi:hypothetical protein|uniref:Uncharacterized protein n=2 Tax=Enterobacteriaceae TaxID=543 RepID=A0A5X0G5K9_SALET|nr:MULTISPECIES: hypothetical protein [Enterobacteriaceae]EAQ7240252.1 hypothetical protein [Salmonella enterica]EBF6276522.1 hypothetical protein [Salmonella enterica subsp. enterica serovar Cubana]EBY7386222.1 hypothetical protein [Salmonella enterica subsp. enterica serovar Braenderup]EEF6878128.1 hypothetical protein [Salmonella enterica subsp. enterica serovar Montevideo]EFX6800430.1 hypothetical protein [Shigella sonnei]EKW7978058.1 hypothetical protein [Enterobacter hormaechei]
MSNNTEVISCDLFSTLSSLNFSTEDITGLTPANFRKGAFLHAKISASQATRATDISIQLLTDRVSGEMNYVIVIGRHEGLLQSEAIDPNADKQYRENRYSRHFISVTDASTKALKKTCKVMKAYIKEQAFKPNTWGHSFIKG